MEDVSQEDIAYPGDFGAHLLQWIRTEVSGRRRLLLVGVLLSCLLLLHLLLNVWLLLLMSGLMAILGSKMGSQAILGTQNRVHLERFIVPHRYLQSPDAESQLDKEIHLTIQKIIQDFVSSWYRTLSREQGFEDEVRTAMVCLAAELKRRMRQVDQTVLTKKFLVMAGCHLQSYMKAKEAADRRDSTGLPDPALRPTRLWQEYTQLSHPHPALRSSATEVSYARGIVDLLLGVLVPKPHLETRTGRYLVVELITCNVLLPLISKMSDPDWINLILTDIFAKAVIKVEPKEQTATGQPEVPLTLPLKVHVESAEEEDVLAPKVAELSSYDVVDGVEDDHEEYEDSKEQQSTDFNAEPNAQMLKDGGMPVQYLQSKTLSPLFLCEDSEPESPMSDMGKDSDSMILLGSEELTSDYRDPLTPMDSSMLILGQEDDVEFDDRMLEHPQATASVVLTPPNGRPEILVNPLKIQEGATHSSLAATSVEEVGNLPLKPPTSLEKERSASPTLSPMESMPSAPLLSSSPTVPINAFSFVPLSSPDGPVVIQNLRITGTITAREHSGTGSHPYTLYTIKYETALDNENLGTLQPMAYHTVNRRYREFLNLQTRLEEKPDLRKFVKNIKGPKKLFPDLPFGNMDIEKVEARKSLLESFLKQLCGIPEIASSEEVQEFLALNTDARIAFVKKPFVVARIDKMMVNAIVDTLKTAFPRSEPQSPTEELSEAEMDGKSQVEAKKSSKSRLRFPSSKIAPVLSTADMQEKVLYSLQEGSNALEALSLTGMELFLKKQEKRMVNIPREAADREAEMCPTGSCEGLSTRSTSKELGGCVQPNVEHGHETVLADAALDVLLLLMKDRWPWVCTDNVQKLIQLLFGTLIQRWLEVQMGNLTCTQRWVIYLRLLQQSIWPGGALRSVPRPSRTQEQKVAAREQALQSLMRILPDLLVEALGVRKCRDSWELVLESLQQPSINRHLVFCVWDILLDVLVLDPSKDSYTGLV
ncbi:sorting nexin-19 [Ambystoma mexicanum]|uniref:sorting nexin-19 n=1 Tax=Ambystoma mexicanum TaxID=8296 RepID=UPI0037E6F9A8